MVDVNASVAFKSFAFFIGGIQVGAAISIGSTLIDGAATTDSFSALICQTDRKRRRLIKGFDAVKLRFLPVGVDR